MKTQSSVAPQIAFWGIYLVALAWVAATLLFEIHLGWPDSGIQWAKRLAGWGVELWLIRALVLGARRYGTSLGK